MTVMIDDPGATVTEQRLSELERELGVRLPEGYRKFVLQFNGGLPRPDIIDVEGAPGSPTDVQVFFGIGRRIESSDLEWNLRMYASRIPAGMLPVACDSGGNLFCISVAGEDAGRVIYVDFEAAEPMSYMVAMDFDLFLHKIRA